MFVEVKNNVIVNVADLDDANIAKMMGLLPYIEGKWIGDFYEDPVIPMEERLACLETQLALVDETAIELYEASLAQEEINAAQDDALIELYELIGG